MEQANLPVRRTSPFSEWLVEVQIDSEWQQARFQTPQDADEAAKALQRDYGSRLENLRVLQRPMPKA